MVPFIFPDGSNCQCRRNYYLCANNIGKKFFMTSKHETVPGLFGQKHSSRDYSQEKFWGKNQFNSSFPASLVAYMSYKQINPVYLCIDKNNRLVHKYITGTELYGMDPLSDNLYYNFETNFFPYEKYYTGKREHIDLVLTDYKSNAVLKGLEIKLTALPDNTTNSLDEDKYSCEIVVRPSTICYLACSICRNYDSQKGREKLKALLGDFPKIKHWDVADEVIPFYPDILDAVENVAKNMHTKQEPLMIQPIWKTNGKKNQLADNCLDVFVWSDLAAVHLCRQGERDINRIARHNRCIIWIYKMLFDFYVYGHFDYDNTINDLSYGTKNDKAFAISGAVSYPLLKSPELAHPRIRKEEIKNIILGGGQNLLSPERRFDAIIVNSPNLF